MDPFCQREGVDLIWERVVLALSSAWWARHLVRRIERKYRRPP